MNNNDQRPSFAQGALIVVLTVAACILSGALLAWSIS